MGPSTTLLFQVGGNWVTGPIFITCGIFSLLKALPRNADHMGWITIAIYFHTILHPAIGTYSLLPVETHPLHHSLSYYLVFVTILFRYLFRHLGYTVFQVPQLSQFHKLLFHPSKQMISALVSSNSTLPHCSQKQKTHAWMYKNNPGRRRSFGIREVFANLCGGEKPYFIGLILLYFHFLLKRFLELIFRLNIFNYLWGEKRFSGYPGKN